MARSRRNQKNIRSALIGCAFVIAISVTSVMGVKAFLNSTTNDKTNPFSPMTYTDIDIYEANGNTFTLANINKSAVITNSKAHNLKPVYIRVAVVTVVRDENNVNMNNKYNYKLGDFTPGANWVYNSNDGYYYYTIPVDPDEQTTDLFNGQTLTIKNGNVTVSALPEDVDRVEIKVVADAIQAVEVDYQPGAVNLTSWDTLYSTAPATAAWGSNIPTLRTSKT